MTEFHGCVAFDADGTAVGDLGRAGLGFAGPGLGRPRVWRDPSAALAVAQRVVTEEDRRERQPTAGPKGCVLVLDGLLFERERVARDLGSDAGAPDSALAAAWLDRHGPGALARLKGDYALARWDPARRELLLAVAPMATRVLYWHGGAGGLWFANTLAGLHRFPGVPREPDTLQLAVHLLSQVLDPADTLFKGVRLVPQGTLVLATGRGAREQAYWRPDPARRLRLARDGDYAEAARELLDRAVRARLRAAGGPAAMLTGGLDSSAVAATAARHLGGSRLPTYTAVPPPGAALPESRGRYADETAAVRAVAALHPNIEPTFCHSGEPSAVELDPTRLFLAGGRSHPMANHLGWFDPMYRAAARDGRAMLLGGAMGNLTLSFDGLRGLGDLARAGRLATLLRLLRPLAAHLGTRPWRLFRSEVLRPALPPRARDGLWRWRHGGRAPWARAGALRPDLAAALGVEGKLWAAGADGMFAHRAGSRELQAHFLHARRTRTLENQATVRALYGIEERDPLSDMDLVDFCLAIPREQFLAGGRSRSLARRVLADLLPASVVETVPVGQQNPEWFTRIAAQRDAFAAELDRLDGHPLAREVLDLPRLRALLEAWPADAQAAEARRFEYECLLPRAVQTGRFLAWLGGGNG